jgi:uncharacterized protein YuzE
MKTTYDRDADALYIRFADQPVAESEEVRPGVVIDFDRDGRMVGVEILDASQHVSVGADLAKATAA